MRLKRTPALEKVARRCVWFQDEDEAFADPMHFIAHVLTFGSHEDLKTLRQQVNDDELRLVLSQAPPGIFDARSWSYWHRMLGNDAVPPLPIRNLEGSPVESQSRSTHS